MITCAKSPAKRQNKLTHLKENGKQRFQIRLKLIFTSTLVSKIEWEILESSFIKPETRGPHGGE
jgi:hypothetical protein